MSTLFCWCVTLGVMLLHSEVYWNPALSINPWISLTCEFQNGLGLKHFFSIKKPTVFTPYFLHPREVYSEKECTGFGLKFLSLMLSGLRWGSVFLFQLREALVAQEQLSVQPHTACPGEKIAWDYVTKDRLAMCMRKRAKLRSCRQFCNDFWLPNFSSAPTLLCIERPYSPSQPPLFCFLSFLFLTHPCPFTESCFCLCFCLLPLFWYFLYIRLSHSAPISRCCLNKQFTA